MNPIDLGAILLLVLGVVLGLRSGALPQIAGLAGAAAGSAGAFAALPLVEPFLADVPAVIRAVAALLLLIAAVGIGETLGAGVGRLVSDRLGGGLLGAADRVLGGLVGAAQAILIVWLVGGILAGGPFPSLDRAAQRSTVVRALGVVLPPPTEVVLALGRLLDASGLPDVFIGLERLPAAPVDLPAEGLIRTVAAAAVGSVVQVRAEVCELRANGSGIVVADGYVVTNAHVVAGARSVVVRTPLDSVEATVVLYDPELDVAVLHAAGLVAPALRFAISEPSRGALGVAIGYPGGGDETILPAAATAVYEATGLDVTGSHRVTRTIVELRAAIEPGDSGGAFVLLDGTIGGLVFAESRTDDAVGYALSPTDVAVRMLPALGRTSPVDTGACRR